MLVFTIPGLLFAVVALSRYERLWRLGQTGETPNAAADWLPSWLNVRATCAALPWLLKLHPACVTVPIGVLLLSLRTRASTGAALFVFQLSLADAIVGIQLFNCLNFCCNHTSHTRQTRPGAAVPTSDPTTPNGAPSLHCLLVLTVNFPDHLRTKT